MAGVKVVALEAPKEREGEKEDNRAAEWGEGISFWNITFAFFTILPQKKKPTHKS